MTRDEVIQEIRSVGRTCRGAYPADAHTTIHAEKIKLLNQDKRDEAAALDARSRISCGYDFNDTIVAGAFDGQLHPYTCPNCDSTGVYRAPLLVD